MQFKKTFTLYKDHKKYIHYKNKLLLDLSPPFINKHKVEDL